MAHINPFNKCTHGCGRQTNRKQHLLCDIVVQSTIPSPYLRSRDIIAAGKSKCVRVGFGYTTDPTCDAWYDIEVHRFFHELPSYWELKKPFYQK